MSCMEQCPAESWKACGSRGSATRTQKSSSMGLSRASPAPPARIVRKSSDYRVLQHSERLCVAPQVRFSSERERLGAPHHLCGRTGSFFEDTRFHGVTCTVVSYHVRACAQLPCWCHRVYP